MMTAQKPYVTAARLSRPQCPVRCLENYFQTNVGIHIILKENIQIMHEILIVQLFPVISHHGLL